MSKGIDRIDRRHKVGTITSTILLVTLICFMEAHAVAVTGICISETSVPVQSVTVSLCATVDTFKVIYSVTTGTDGLFEFTDIAEIDYYIKVTGGGYPLQWYSATSTTTTRYPFDIFLPAYNVDASMVIRLMQNPVDNPSCGSVTLQAIDSNGNYPVNAGMAYLVNQTDNTIVTLGHDYATGTYRIENIPAGNYYVKLEIAPYPVQYYNPSGNETTPKYVLVVGENTMLPLTITLTLTPQSVTTGQLYGYVKGVVSDRAGTVENAMVNLYTPLGNILQSIVTTKSGTFGPLSVPSGALYITISTIDRKTMLWSQAGMTDELSESNMVQVMTGDTFIVNAFLPTMETVDEPIYRIQGSVFSQSTGAPIKNCRIVLFDYNPGGSSSTRHMSSPWMSTTDSTGLFEIDSIPQGSYHGMAEAEQYGYVTSFFPNSDDYALAHLIPIDGTTEPQKLDFTLRKGATIQGVVKTTTGGGIGGATIFCVNQENTRFFETMSLKTGEWNIPGIPAGTWNVQLSHGNYIAVMDTQQRAYTLVENTIKRAPDFVLEAGGYVSGAFFSTVAVNEMVAQEDPFYGELLLVDTSNADNNKILWPAYGSALFFNNISTDGKAGYFISDVTKTGRFLALFTPRPIADQLTTTLSTKSPVRGMGYSFVKAVADGDTVETITMVAGDTLRNAFLQLRQGYSVFGMVKNEAGVPLMGNYGVDVFVKTASGLLGIAHSVQLQQGMFEISGLIDKEKYYLMLRADGYPVQFWKSGGNTTAPETTYTFTVAEFTPLVLTVSKTITGIDPNAASGPISLWVENDSAGMPLLAWTTDAKVPLSQYTLYGRDRLGTMIKIVTIPDSGSSTIRYRHRLVSGQFMEYIVTGTGSLLTVKSNSIGFDPRNTTATNLWLTASASRWGIMLEWGGGNGEPFTGKDSVYVYRRSGQEQPVVHSRQSAWNNLIDDHDWKKSDSGKTFTYFITIPARGLVSPNVSFMLDKSFFEQLPRVLTVGPYEKYRHIADAIAAAADFDQIEVTSGTYVENISLGGKKISINGLWNYGKPPVLDGGGRVAIHVPFVKTANSRYFPRISGLAIKNSSIGVKAQGDVEVEACLFDKVTVGVAMSIDSAAMVNYVNTDPFRLLMIRGNIRHCTFIARKPGSLVASVSAAGPAERPGYTGMYGGMENYLLKPCVSMSCEAYIDRSNITFYQTSGLQAEVPVSISGNTSRMGFNQCNFWKTSMTLGSVYADMDKNNTGVDPQFSDSLYWLVKEGSPLAGTTRESTIGYQVRAIEQEGGFDGKKRPSPVHNVSAATVGLKTVLVRWTAAPSAEDVARYRVYRVPGNRELYYVNQRGQWDLAVPTDSMDIVADSFSTVKNAFLDTTATTGTPYLYVVASVTSDGVEGEVGLPDASLDITKYFVNGFPEPVVMKTGLWNMVGGLGGETLRFDSSSSHVLFGWDCTGKPDKLYARYIRETSMRPTRGYWFKAASDTSFTVNSKSVRVLENQTTPVVVSLQKGSSGGWNLVASPYPFDVRPSWLDRFNAWEWNADSAGYRKANALRPWKAYWIYSSVDTALPLVKKQSIGAYLESGLAKTSARSFLWRLRLSLQCGKSFDTDNFIGALTKGLAKASPQKSFEPPQPFDGARLSIVDDENRENKLAELYKRTTTKGEAMEWIVSTGTSDRASLLRIDDVAGLPEGLYAFWVEKDRMINLREQDSIVIPASSTDRWGMVLITSDLGNIGLYTGQLLLTAPIANSGRGSAVIDYVIPYSWATTGEPLSGKAAMVSLRMYDIAGRQVATIVRDYRKPGIYRTIWSGKNSNGQPVAAGMYFLQLTCEKASRVARFCRVR